MNIYSLYDFEVDLSKRSDAIAVGQYDEQAKRIQVAGSITNSEAGASIAMLWERIAATPHPT